jgi:M6 family metalloprotease-like protein
MRLKSVLGTLIVTSLVASVAPSYSAPAPKAGAVCKKAGISQSYKGKVFTCIKNGKKLVWNKGELIKQAVPIPMATPTPSPSPTPSPTASTPLPTPSPSPTVTVTRPFFMGFDQKERKHFLRFRVFEDADGAFVVSEELNLNKSNTSVLKDSSGTAIIEVDFPEFPKVSKYTFFFYAFNSKGVSPCCISIAIDSGGPPGETDPTRVRNGENVSSYKTPPAITTSPSSILSNSAPFEDLSKCRLPDGDPELTNMTVGFPVPQGRVDFTRKAIVQLLPVSFADVPASTDPVRDYDTGISFMKNFWEAQSFVDTKIEVRSPRTYKQLPNPVLSYGLDSSLNGFQGQKYAAFIRQVVDLYDAEIDYTGVSTVVVVVPLSVTKEQIGTWVVDTQNTFKTKEGDIFNYMITGNGDSKNKSGAWVHEYGHALGLTDMRFVDRITPTIQRPEGLGIFDIMGSGNAAPETLLWSRFLINILAPKQVLCITAPSTSTHWIRPLVQRDKGLKGLIIPTGTYTALVVESRRAYGFDSYLSPRDAGALVYRVDTRIPYRRSPMQIIQPARSQDKEWYTDSALRLNEFVIADGWKITVVESGEFGDVVKVEKV